MREILKQDEPGKRVFMMGNYGIARGAIEAGVNLVAGYPGTPSSECLEILGEVSHDLRFYAEMSVNEKVATEIASGASIAGQRSLVTMKHVGMNVAADQLNVVNLSGVKGGMVIYCADDMGGWVSQNEQDTRPFAEFLHLPCLSAIDPQDAKELTKFGFDLSEKYKVPVILRTTERVSHASGIVEFGPMSKRAVTPKFEKKMERYILGDVFMQALHAELHDKLEKMELTEATDNKFDIVKKVNSKLAVIADGPSYLYAVEALKYLGAEDKVSILRISFTNPLPRKKIADFLQGVEKLAVIEEIEPYLEDRVKSILVEQGRPLPKVFIGRKSGDLPWMNELNVDLVGTALGRLLDAKYTTPNDEFVDTIQKSSKLAPTRTFNFCAGCPHLATSYAIKKAILKSGKLVNDVVVTTDIGCYGLGPFSAPAIMDTSFCMGSGVTMAQGFKLALPNTPVIATIGDSTFFHAGMTGLVNLMWNKTPVLLIVMDNRITAMTGHQPNAGVNIRLDGTVAKALNAEDFATAAGYEFIEIVDPNEVKTATEAIQKGMKYVEAQGKPALIVARRECALMVQRGVEHPTTYIVTTKACIGCKICVTQLGCQAIGFNTDNNEAVIDAALCVGCGVCSQVCPVEECIVVAH